MVHGHDGAGREVGDDDLDLAKLASHLRRVMPSVDEATRQRLEAAWVSLTNAVKQPHMDAERLRVRLRRLRTELDAWAVRFGREEPGDDSWTDEHSPAAEEESARE